MSTQAAPALTSLDSLMPDFSEPASEQVGNACPREWTYLHSSAVFTWQPGEVRPVEEILGPQVDEEFGKPIPIPHSAYQIVNGVKRVPRHMLRVKQGCTLHEILKGAFEKEGCPLYLAKNDGRDDQRARLALDKWRKWRLPIAQHEIEVNLAKAARERDNNLPATPKHPGVRAAEADIRDIRRMQDVGQGRYVVRVDNEVFEYLDDAEQYITDTFPEHKESWRMWVTDRVGGTAAFRKASAAEVAPAPAPVPTGAAQGTAHSVAALGILALAEKSEKVLPEELVARLDSDPEAVREAMEFIWAKKPKGAAKA